MRGLIKKGIDAYLDFKSFKTSHPVVVIESDDWGSLRTKNTETREKLNQISKLVKEDPYTQLDSIATQSDLENLFDVLKSVKDRNGNPACITANVCTANPDFLAIKHDNFERFHYVPFTKTLEDYSENTSLFELWEQGRKSGVFKPQLHGREHVHALAWLAELKAGNNDLLAAFELETWGIPYKAKTIQRRANLQAALDYYGLHLEENYHKEWIADSVQLFNEAFGFNPKSFIPPAYTWHSKVHQHLKSEGIISVQGIKLQYQPEHTLNTKYSRKPHYIGQKDKSGLRYTTRNAFFEPYSSNYRNNNSKHDLVNLVLQEIDNAIKQKKPAIIGTHRVNYIGRLDIKHRDRNLNSLKSILSQVVKKYPNVEFMDSVQLSNYLF